MNETLENMAKMLEERWNATDTELHKQYHEFMEAHNGESFDVGMGRKVSAYFYFTQGFTQSERDVISYGLNYAKKQNAKLAKAFVENLESRVKRITGEITEWHESATEQSNYSYVVKGEKGSAKVTQIYAGGYNIVRLHIRNIIKAL